jgi:hypothetical protein
MYRDILILVFIGCGLYLFDIFSKPKQYTSCTSFRVQFIILIHHIFNSFAYFAWLSNDRFILKTYIVLLVAAITYWTIMKGKCQVTEYTNQQCDIPRDTYMNDIFTRIGLKDGIALKLYFTVAILVVIMKLNNSKIWI